MSKRKRKSGLILVAVAGAAAIAVAGIGIWKQQNNNNIAISQDGDTIESTAKEIVQNDQTYVYNEHISNYLFLGIDNREVQDTQTGQADAGQSDSLYLISWDRVENTLTRINIPRDTITEIEVFSMNGNSMGLSEDHISLAYGYGDGKHESCKLSKEAVSRLFFDIPIQGYCSISLDALPLLTESVGEVDVVVPNDSLLKVNPDYKKGTTVTLNKDNTEQFVRYRDIETTQSALSRMERQEAFLDAFGKKVKERFKKNPLIVTELYKKLDPYMVTNISNDQFVKLMKASNEGTSDQWTIPGEGVEGDYYDEYHVDEEAFREKVMETFYVKAE